MSSKGNGRLAGPYRIGIGVLPFGKMIVGILDHFLPRPTAKMCYHLLSDADLVFRHCLNRQGLLCQFYMIGPPFGGYGSARLIRAPATVALE